MVESRSTASPLGDAPHNLLAVRISPLREAFGGKAMRKMSNYLAQNRLAFGLERSVAVLT